MHGKKLRTVKGQEGNLQTRRRRGKDGGEEKTEQKKNRQRRSENLGVKLEKTQNQKRPTKEKTTEEMTKAKN